MARCGSGNPSDSLSTIGGFLAEGDLAAAVEVAEATLSQPAEMVDGICGLAVIAARKGRTATAIELLEKVLEQPGRSSDVPEALAVLHCLAGNVSDALYYAKLATTEPCDNRLLPLFGPTFPIFADAFAQISNKPLLRKARDVALAGGMDAALSMVEQHLQLNPTDVEALDFRSYVLCELGRYPEAIGVLRSVMTMAGPSATLMSRLGECLLQCGEFEEAVSCHRSAVRRAPKAAPLWAAMLRTWAHVPWPDGKSWDEALAGWEDLLAETAPKTTRPLPPGGGKDRLCIGFLCGGQHHSDTRALIGRVAAAFDRSSTKVVGFGRGDLADPSNLLFRGAFDRWRDTEKVDELTLAQLVRGEAVDVLIDADGLVAGERYNVFSRKAAPLQFSWLGTVPGWSVPGAHGRLGAEAGPSCGPLLLDRADAMARDLPAKTAGHITFGADAAMSELNPEVVRVWSEILLAVPDSVLVLADRGMSGSQAVDRLIARFGNFGVAHRIDLADATPETFFTQIDIALAPFPMVRPAPYGAALSMGVPVIVHDHAGSAALASAVAKALPDGGRMVSPTLGGYVESAVAWAGDLASLADFRREAPARIVNSPVYDAQAFAAEWLRFFAERLASTRGE